MTKKEKHYEYDVSKILTEDFDDIFDEALEKERRRLKWESRKK